MKKLFLFGAIVFSCFIGSNTPVYGQADLYLDSMNVYVSEYGRVSIFSLPDTIRQLYRAALLVGTGPDAVFDLQNDLEVEEPTSFLTSPTFGDYEIYGSYNNDYSGAPPNVLEKENILLRQYNTDYEGLYNEDISLDELEKKYIKRILDKTGWNVKEACEILKISKATIYRKIEQYKLSEK